MDVLRAEKRTENIKPRRLRADGLIPGCVYGGKLEETIMFQAPEGAVLQLVRAKAEGSKVTLDLGGTKHVTLLKEIAREPSTNRIQHLSFQALVADEEITSVARINLLNRDRVSGFIQQLLFEIPYKALPAYMVESVTVDLEGVEIGDSVSLADLDIAKNDAIELLIEADSPVVNIIEQRAAEASDEDEEGDLGEEAATEAEEEA